MIIGTEVIDIVSNKNFLNNIKKNSKFFLKELNNLKIINLICDKMDKKLKNSNKSNSLISFVQDSCNQL